MSQRAQLLAAEELRPCRLCSKLDRAAVYVWESSESRSNPRGIILLSRLFLLAGRTNASRDQAAV